MNLPILQMSNIATVQWEGKKQTHLSNWGKQYIDWIPKNKTSWIYINAVIYILCFWMVGLSGWWGVGIAIWKFDSTMYLLELNKYIAVHQLGFSLLEKKLLRKEGKLKRSLWCWIGFWSININLMTFNVCILVTEIQIVCVDWYIHILSSICWKVWVSREYLVPRTWFLKHNSPRRTLEK